MKNEVITIDLGSNSFRVLKYDCLNFKIIDEYHQVVGLADGLINSGLINANGVSDYASRGIGVIGISGNSNIINHGLINLVYNNNSQHGGLESAPGLGITGDANLKIVTNNGLIRVLSIDNGGSSSAFINGILIYQNSKVQLVLSSAL